MQGLILAAGRGSRLGGRSAETPKCLLEVARRPLIEHQLAACADAGVAPMAVVVGYCGDEIKQVLGLRAEYIDNPRWATTNSIYSFWQARDWVKGPLVVMNCDVLFEPEILSRLLAAGADSLAYDSSSGRGLEQMKVKVRDGCITDMSKQLPIDESAGENLGMLYFSAETVKALMTKAGELIAAGGENSWFPAAVREIAQTRSLKAVDVAGLSWAEIDSAWDLDHARKKVWPKIARATGQRTRRKLLRWLAPLPLTMAAGMALWGFSRPTPELPRPAYETVPLPDAASVNLKLREHTETWWLLAPDQSAAAIIEGPGKVRLESRFVLPGDELPTPYVLRLEIDDSLVDLDKSYGRLDAEAEHEDWPIARRRSETYSLPPGPHSFKVKLVGADPGHRCLIRLRTPEGEAEPDTEAEGDAQVPGDPKASL